MVKKKKANQKRLFEQHTWASPYLPVNLAIASKDYTTTDIDPGIKQSLEIFRLWMRHHVKRLMSN